MTSEREPAMAARLACGCRLAFRTGVEGSPVTVIVARKAETCSIAIHVAGQPVFDHREARRASTRLAPETQPDYGEEG